jgi:hypothetical protein
MTEPIPFAGYVDIGEDMTLLEEATKLADDIAEYAPDTNIEIMMRRLIKEIERLTPKPIYEADFVKIAKLKLEAGEE